MIYDVKAYFRGLKDIYIEEVHNGLDFWARNGIDWEKGGIITYLDRAGNWYHDEKQGWFQGRAMYSFARGYNTIHKNPRWLEAAECLYKFMTAHQFTDNGRMYYNMSRDGVPCDSHPRAGRWPALQESLFTESFSVMGLSEYYRATGLSEVRDLMRKVFDTMLFLYKNPEYVKNGTLNQSGKQLKVGLAWLMMLLCSTQTIRENDPENRDAYTAHIAEFIAEVKKHYYHPERNMVMEGEIDCPGHNMEVAWFMLAEGLYIKDQALIDMCADMVGRLYEIGWDKVHGGYPTIINMDGKPAFSQDGDIRLWWTHNELEIGLLYAYIGTGKMEYLEKFRIVHDWIFAHFPDREQGEWYGWLHYDGTLISDNKGDNQKGPYHLYRSFYAIHDIIVAYLKKNI